MASIKELEGATQPFTALLFGGARHHYSPLYKTREQDPKTSTLFLDVPTGYNLADTAGCGAGAGAAALPRPGGWAASALSAPLSAPSRALPTVKPRGTLLPAVSDTSEVSESGGDGWPRLIRWSRARFTTPLVPE